MSAAAPSSTVVRSHSTSSRYPPSHQPSPSDLPHRTRSAAVRPSAASHHSRPVQHNQYPQQGNNHFSHSRSQSYDPRPPSSHAAPTHAPAPVPDNITRWDSEASRGSRPGSSRRGSLKEHSQERAPVTAHRSEHAKRHHHRTPSTNSYQRDGADMSVPAPPVAEGAPASANLHPPLSSMQPKRRTTITTPSGQWILGKTIGAGSMGKVKLAKNMETGEQAAIKIIPRQSPDEHRGRDSERADRSKETRTAREAAIVSLADHPYICGMRDVVRTTYHWYMVFEYVNGGQMLDYIISHVKLKEKQARKFARQVASALDYCHRNSIVHRDLKIENILISKTGDIKIIDFGLSNLFSPRSLLKTFCGSLYFAAPELLQARQYTGPEVDVWSFGVVLYVLVCGKVPFDDQSMPQLHAKIKKGVVEYPQGLSSECRHIISRMLVTDPHQRASLAEIMNHPWMLKGYNGPPENYLPAREPLHLPFDQEVIEKMTGFEFGPPDYITAQLTKIVDSEDYQHAVRNAYRESPTIHNHHEKRRGMFDFYKRRNSASRDNLSVPSAETVQFGNDPLNAYSPLISVYYLAKEKLDREKAEAKPGALGLTVTPGETVLKMPDLPAPEAAHTNQYQIPGEMDTGRRARPRARTHGDEDVTGDLKNLRLTSNSARAPANSETPTKKESTAAGLLRRFSTRKTKDRGREIESEKNSQPQAPSLNVQPPTDSATPLHRGFSLRRTRRADPSPPADPSSPDYLKAPGSAPEGSRSNKLFGRSTSVNSADYLSRRSARRDDTDSLNVAAGRQNSPADGSDQFDVDGQKGRPEDRTAMQESKRTGHTHAARTMSLGHARRESIQARRAKREAAREADVPEETDADISGAGTALESANDGEDLSKPVYLKGLFSVSTTSTKPLSVIRADIIRVLNLLSVEHVEIKGGFRCRHAPSIALDRTKDAGSHSFDRQGSGPNNNRRRFSFGGFLNNDDSTDESRTRSQRRTHGGPDRSFVTNSEESDDYVPHRGNNNNNNNNNNAGERVLGETTTHVQSDTGENLVLRFEILIVKVPLFTLHGIQFKKVAGGTWQYREMAKKILDALRL